MLKPLKLLCAERPLATQLSPTRVGRAVRARRPAPTCARASSDAPRPLALVTGGTRGIGLHIAHRMAEDGYDLLVGFNRDAARAETAAQGLRATGARVETVGGDLADPATVASYFAVVRSRFDNRINAIVHNAGCRLPGGALRNPDGSAFAGTSPSAAQTSLPATFAARVNYYMTIYPYALDALVEAALQCDGLSRVVAVSAPGCSGQQAPIPMYLEPGLAKGAMELLVRTRAAQLAERGITLNCVLPGNVATDGLDAVVAAIKQGASAPVAGNAFGTVTGANIAAAVAGFCRADAEAITGQLLHVDNGRHLRR